MGEISSASVTAVQSHQLGFADTDLDRDLTGSIAELNASCSYCPGFHNRAYCATCITELKRCSMVNIAQRQLMKGVLTKCGS